MSSANRGSRESTASATTATASDSIATSAIAASITAPVGRRCSAVTVMTADPMPRMASWVHSIIAAMAPAASPTSCGTVAWAASNQNRKPHPIAAPLLTINPSAFSTRRPIRNMRSGKSARAIEA